MLDALTIVIFPALMTYAAFSDLLTMTISNWISIVLVAAFVVLAFLFGVPATAIGLHLAAGLMVLAITFTLFAFGWIGGGDAKLAATTAVWMGFEHLAEYGLGSAVIGGLLTLVLLQFRRLPMPGWARARAWLMRLHDKDNGVPYGIALAAAGLILYPETRIYLSAFAA
ncbi:prepilin peptidase [Rhodoblastus acidophilus]|uniref:Prepilin peptidase n=1 Tax=Candidatus Rhodoblastus alkanivorans TaxID=2954117 RepID=A0ABS9ZAY1_9HYPH|nr:prepilin peptidase [Candidatus Rhodoblastus alkanivorans]MCI4677801.1 prepilin peptidase [Candidatus Rhodoblastus alkanivorans]MCI4684701.1 prepilin peptidase [Candidatus Rhodoblastus alkanivorans]MDI4642023.1 prepilin peptidase [Rhodoblastus acidophilus]